MLFKWNLQPDYFNPRSHEGSDTLEKYIYATGTDFNPRSHEGSDWNTVEINRNHYGFQSALPRGERRFVKCFKVPSADISIRAPTRGATWVMRP